MIRLKSQHLRCAFIQSFLEKFLVLFLWRYFFWFDYFLRFRQIFILKLLKLFCYNF